MMFRTIWSKTLRDYRIPILCWGLGLGLAILSVYSTYGSEAQGGNSQATLQELAQQFSFLGEPIAVNTADGFITWRSLGLAIPVLLSIWTLLTGARLVRGEEERNSMDLLLSTPRSRTRLMLEKLVALIIALVIIGLLIGLGAAAGEAQLKIDVRLGATLLTGLNISLFAFFISTLALFISQFVRSRGAAAGWAGAILALATVIDITGRTVDGASWVQYFSPFYYYNLNKPLIASYEGHPWAALVLLGLSFFFIILSAFLFVRRDIGGVALSFARRSGISQQQSEQRAFEHASRDISCRAVSLRSLRAQSVSAFWWLLGLAAYTLWATSLTPSLLKPLQDLVAGNPMLQAIFSGQNMTTTTGFIGSIVFLIAPILSVAFALYLALAWPSDLEGGRLELVMSTPISRTRLQLERFLAVVIFAMLAPLLTWGMILLGAQMVNINVDHEKIAAASLGLFPLELVMATFVYAVAIRLRGGVILGLSALYLALAFLGELIKGQLDLPEWLMSLSIFHVYGNPALDGWRWGQWGILLGVALAFLLIGIVQFRLANVDRGA